jgi:regulation of enolase protein 1 (concanavalin A-like superfamily)
VVPPRYYIENIKALMDAPGEWYFDKKSGELSFIPPAGIEDPNELFCIAPSLDNVFTIKGNREKPVRNLRFYGLSFEGVNDGSAAVSFEYAHQCELVDSRLKAMAGRGVYLGLGCFQNRILSNTISDLGGSAITVAGQAHPEYWMDIIRETVISYNFIEKTGESSITAHNCLNTIISHNEVTNNHGRTAISVGGWSNLEEAIDGGYRVEYNHVHHVQSRADDSGAITTAGMTYDSVVRNNLIHHVKAGYFNNNVAIWFDNMSLGWTAENNILYGLEQDDMKLCACNLVDNHYRGNFMIDVPLNEPEGIIVGEPEFEFSNLQVASAVNGSADDLKTGDYIRVSASVTNNGASGTDIAELYVDGKIEQRKKIPVIKNNSRTIYFETRFTVPGEHQVAISSTAYKKITVKGERPLALYDSLKVSSDYLPDGETLHISVLVKNVQENRSDISAPLIINDQIVDPRQLILPTGEIEMIRYAQNLKPGKYKIQVGNTPAVFVEVYPYLQIDIASAELKEYCSGTADPCVFDVKQKTNQYVLETAGTDFMHGEDSYGSVYFKEPLKGNFVATVKLIRFGKRTHDWFRAGLFVRNDMEKSFDTADPSLGSVLLFVTPGRVGMNWDRFGNGAMHWASSENHQRIEPYPMWLKLVRHGNSFSGYVSYDGENWTVERHTEVIPGIAEAVHLGLAAGGCDERAYTVEFADLQVIVEKDGWKYQRD